MVETCRGCAKDHKNTQVALPDARRAARVVIAREALRRGNHVRRAEDARALCGRRVDARVAGRGPREAEGSERATYIHLKSRTASFAPSTTHYKTADDPIRNARDRGLATEEPEKLFIKAGRSDCVK